MSRKKAVKRRGGGKKKSKRLSLHPEFHKMARLDPGIHEVTALLVRAEPPFRRWTEGLMINWVSNGVSVAVGAAFAAFVLVSPAAVQKKDRIGEDSAACETQYARQFNAAMTPLPFFRLLFRADEFCCGLISSCKQVPMLNTPVKAPTLAAGTKAKQSKNRTHRGA